MRRLLVIAVIVISAFLGASVLNYLLLPIGFHPYWTLSLLFVPLFLLAAMIVPEGGPLAFVALMFLENFTILLVIFSSAYWIWWRRNATKTLSSRPNVDRI